MLYVSNLYTNIVDSTYFRMSDLTVMYRNSFFVIFIYQNFHGYIQFIDLVTPENSKCVQCDGTGYLYLPETGQCQDPEGQFVDKR